MQIRKTLTSLILNVLRYILDNVRAGVAKKGSTSQGPRIKICIETPTPARH